MPLPNRSLFKLLPTTLPKPMFRQTRRERSYPLFNLLTFCHKEILWGNGWIIPVPSPPDMSCLMPISYLNIMRLQKLRFCLLQKAGVRARSRQTCTAFFIVQALLLPVLSLYFGMAQLGHYKTRKHRFLQILSALAACSIGDLQERILWWNILSILIPVNVKFPPTRVIVIKLN